MWMTKSVFLWYRSQRDMHLCWKLESSSSRSSDGNSSLLDEGGSASQVPQASEVRVMFMWTRNLENSSYHNREFPAIVRSELMTCTNPLTSTTPHLHSLNVGGDEGEGGGGARHSQSDRDDEGGGCLTQLLDRYGNQSLEGAATLDDWLTSWEAGAETEGHCYTTLGHKRHFFFGIPQLDLWGSPLFFFTWDRLVGLVERRPPWERKIPGSNPSCAGIFSGSSHTSDLNIGTPVATLQGAWRYRVSSGTDRPGVSIL